MWMVKRASSTEWFCLYGCSTNYMATDGCETTKVCLFSIQLDQNTSQSRVELDICASVIQYCVLCYVQLGQRPCNSVKSNGITPFGTAAAIVRNLKHYFNHRKCVNIWYALMTSYGMMKRCWIDYFRATQPGRTLTDGGCVAVVEY